MNYSQPYPYPYPPENAHLYYYSQNPDPSYCSPYEHQHQRRHMAGAMLGSFFQPRKKVSTAQPRPQIRVMPYGPIYDRNQHDVLCGRGGRVNNHFGNVHFRELVQMRKKEYLSKKTKKLQKAHIAADIVQQIRSLSGRFLKDDINGNWYEIGDEKAIKKVGQALREDGASVRQELEKNKSASSVDDSSPEKPASKKLISEAKADTPTMSNSRKVATPITRIHLPKQVATGRSAMPSPYYPQEISEASKAASRAMEFDVAFGKNFFPAHELNESNISGLSKSETKSEMSVQSAHSSDAEPIPLVDLQQTACSILSGGDASDIGAASVMSISIGGGSSLLSGLSETMNALGLAA